jgi:hypothetical protein
VLALLGLAALAMVALSLAWPGRSREAPPPDSLYAAEPTAQPEELATPTPTDTPAATPTPGAQVCTFNHSARPGLFLTIRKLVGGQVVWGWFDNSTSAKAIHIDESS